MTNAVIKRIPSGYKEGRYYIIPKHWEDVVISDVVKFSGGSQPPRSEFINYPREGYVRLIQIRDYKTDDYLTFIPLEKARKFCDETDIMIGRYGPPIFQILRGLKGAYNVALMKAIPDEKRLLKDYLYYYLQNETLFLLIDRLSRRTSGQTGVDIEALNNFPFPLPPIVEQRKILDIIQTWDKAIELKEKLIEQKKEQKKGLMQKLLTGEVRLPGFSNKWGKVYLGEVCSVTTGNKDTQNKVENGKYPFFVRSQVVERINSYSFDGEAILTAGDGVGVGKVFHYINGKFDFHQRVYKLSNFNGIDGYFLYCYFSQNFMKQIKKYNAKTSVDSVRMEMLTKMQIPLPEMEEQKMLGQLFKTLENEIELINKELETIKNQKQGLMQQLLTGKIRVKV